MNPLTVTRRHFSRMGGASETFRLLRGRVSHRFIPGVWIKFRAPSYLVFGIVRKLFPY